MRTPHTFLLLAVGLAAGLPAQSRPAQAPPAPARAEKPAEAPSSPLQFTFTLDGKTLTITTGDSDLKVLVDGKALPAERLITRGNRYQVLDERSNPRVEFLKTEGGGSLRYLTATPARPSLGIQVAPLDESLSTHLGIDQDAALRVQGVTSGGVAGRAGVKVHDILLSVDGVRPVNMESLQKVLQSKKPGQKVRLEVQRRNKTLDVDVELDAGPVAGIVQMPTDFLRQAEIYSTLGQARVRGSAEFQKRQAQQQLYAAIRNLGKVTSGSHAARHAAEVQSVLQAQEQLRNLQRANEEIERTSKELMPSSVTQWRGWQLLPHSSDSPLLSPSAAAGAPPKAAGGTAAKVRNVPLVLTSPAPAAPDLRPDLRRIEQRLTRLEELLESVLKGEKKEN